MLSPQRAEYSAEMIKAYRIGFPMLRDFHNEVAAQYGIAFDLPDYLDKLYRDFGNDPMLWNDMDHWQLPMPARFIIDREGIIEDVQADPDYTVRPEPETILTVLAG